MHRSRQTPVTVNADTLKTRNTIPRHQKTSFGISQNPRIIHLSGGRRALDVSTEYGDAMRMKQLEEMGGNLNQSYRAELVKISEKYDLTYFAQ